MKIVMSEVTTAKTSIESSKSKLQRQFNNAKGSWKGVVSSDGLSGKVKTAIDAEINNYQIPLLTNYYDVMHQLSTEFTKAISDFKSTVKETSASAIIDTDALTTAESKFSDQLTKFTEIETKFKTVYSSISDLVSVSEVSGSGFTEEMEKTKKVLTNTKTWMATFNGKKSSKAINSILSQQQSQINRLKSVAGLSYTNPKSLEIYQNKAFNNQVSKQHKAVKDFEKKKLEAERRELLKKHPANAAISGHLSVSESKNINKEINKLLTKLPNGIEALAFFAVSPVVSPVLGFEYNAKGDYYYTNKHSIQSIGGFMDFYDKVGPFLGMNLDEEIIYFNANGREYRLELWKGSYGFKSGYGAEVGIYYKNKESDKFVTKTQSSIDGWYACVDPKDQLPIKNTIYDRQTQKKLFSNDTRYYAEEGKHFWNLAIRTDSGYKKENLMTRSEVEVVDKNMRNEMYKSLKNNKNISSIRIEGNRISFTWKK